MKIKLSLLIILSLLFIDCEKTVDKSVIVNMTDFYPKGQTHQIIKHKYYSLSYSEPDEQAEWVAYILTSKMASGLVARTDDYREDPLITTASAALSDYAGSGYDRGHLCPAEDMSFTKEAMSETFYLSNMSPQDPSFNRGIWSSLEARVRSWSNDNDSLFIITGPVLTSNNGFIGTNKVTVPKYYYKVVLENCRPTFKMIAFLLPNEKGTGSLGSYVVTTDSVEKITGIDFFPNLPDNIETVLESKRNIEDWNFNK